MNTKRENYMKKVLRNIGKNKEKKWTSEGKRTKGSSKERVRKRKRKKKWKEEGKKYR
jgi:hypothetical protein